jgi:galactokinase
MEIVERLVAHFRSQFNAAPAVIVRAPGRVNLIGEHTDYNDGFVLPMAIDRGIWIALRPARDRRVTLYSLDFHQAERFSLDEVTPHQGAWGNYVRGMAWALARHGYATLGWEGVMAGNVPRGAGLSSSAALEMAVAKAFAVTGDWAWDGPAMARIGQECENQWVGVNSGIMDQMISAAGVKGHALLIDCRSLAATPVPLPPGVAVVVMDTGTRRGLVDSAYNERRRQCETAAAHFGVAALRDVTPVQLDMAGRELGELVYRRARHVVSENQRVLAASVAMRTGDSVALGKLFYASHASLRDDFAVSCQELDMMVATAMTHPACYGARMTGAGFGGCAVAIVRSEQVNDFMNVVSAQYARHTGRTAQLYLCQAEDGAGIVAEVPVV